MFNVITTRLRPLATDMHVRRATIIALLPLALTLIATLASSQAQPVEPTTQAQAIILIATPTPALATPVRAIVGYWDLGSQPVALVESQIARIVGQAEDSRWRLIETEQGARVWVLASDLPADLPSDQPLEDFTPATAAPTVMPAPSEPAQVVEPTRLRPSGRPSLRPTKLTPLPARALMIHNAQKNRET